MSTLKITLYVQKGVERAIPFVVVARRENVDDSWHRIEENSKRKEKKGFCTPDYETTIVW